jgi:hypothetical protein
MSVVNDDLLRKIDQARQSRDRGQGQITKPLNLNTSTSRSLNSSSPEEQVLFGFVNEISLSPKKRDRDATASILQPNSSHVKS